MKNYIMLDGKKIELSEETAENLKRELAVKKEVWKPKKNEKYYLITGKGSVEHAKNKEWGIDIDLLKYGNYFKTKEEAEKISKIISLYLRMSKWADTFNDEFDLSRNTCRYYIYFNKKTGFEIRWVDLNNNSKEFFQIYFSSKKLAEQCLSEFREELEVLI